MEEREMREFSWTGLFLVTGLCFFIFSGILEYLDHTHPSFFIWIGSISIFLGLLNIATRSMSRATSKANRKLSS
jgi:uncharacterized membrane protein YgdD (TMEM256/DUF423 family)